MVFILLVAFGALLRLRQYLANQSLWMDEARLALNVLGRSTADLVLKPLDFNQAAPPGFLFLVKLGVLAWGGSEYVLRLVPLLFSLASLLLFTWVARRALAPAGALVALALFGSFPTLIRYAAESKQYGLDVTIGLGVIAATLPFLDGPTGPLNTVVLCLAGAVAVWLSHPAPFFLAAAGVVLLIQWPLKRSPAIGILITIGAIWIASFAVVYVVSLRDLSGHQGLREAWSSAFPPSMLSISTVRWLGSNVEGLFGYAFRDRAVIFGAFAVLAGGAALLTVRPFHFALFVVPMGFALLAALVGRYPFQNRLILFALPLLALLAGAGAEYVRKGARNSPAILVLFTGLLLFSPVFISLSRLTRPNGLEEIRPVIAYMQRHSLPDDVAYLTPSAKWAYRYYAPRIGFNPRQVVIGDYDREDWRGVAADLDQVRSRGRVWVVLSHFFPDEERFIRYHLDTLGIRRDSFTATGAMVLLYDLR
ncbi:MAG TPA: hypothetical protein VI007_08355 [bacterium]